MTDKWFKKVFRSMAQKHLDKAEAIDSERKDIWREHQDKLMELAKSEWFDLAEHDAECDRFDAIDAPLKAKYEHERDLGYRFEDLAMMFA